jgi:putative transposase
MPWRNFTMEEERLNFISKALDPHRELNFSQLCEDNNISTKTGYKWLNRYHERGKEGLKDLSRSPHTQPSKIPEEIEKAVIVIRQKFPKWGPKKIHAFMKEHCNNMKIPSEGSIGNILQKNNLSHPRSYRRHVAQTASLEACLEPNDTWMYDFKGWFYTKNGEKCEPLTITDGFSRYLIACEHMNRKRGIDVWNVLERAFLEFGLPNKMRSDNGPPFASLGVGRLSKVAIKLIKLGITPEWIKPGCPQENGRHERFHLTLKQETAQPPALTLSLQQEKFNQI